MTLIFPYSSFKKEHNLSLFSVNFSYFILYFSSNNNDDNNDENKVNTVQLVSSCILMKK